MKLDMDALLKSMLTAAEKELKARWPKARDYAGMEFQKILLEAQHIGELKDANKITEQEATYLMDLQRNAARVVLLTIEGLGIIAVEAAINAALDAVRAAINAALGSWKIL
ncbi:MAG: hypothetical protein WA117_19185 [Verrucomicrobiia bacterium]